MARMIVAVPRSLPASTRPTDTIVIGTIGIATSRHSCSASPLRDSIQASQITSASLISSDGCAVNDPRLIQLRFCPRS